MEFVKIKNRNKPGASLVLAQKDFDPAVHELFEEPAAGSSTSESGTSKISPATTQTTDPGGTAPVDIVSLSVAKAGEVIVTASAEQLDAFEASEKAHPKYSGGRQGVLEAIAARRDELAKGASS